MVLTCSWSGFNICRHQLTSEVWRKLMLTWFFQANISRFWKLFYFLTRNSTEEFRFWHFLFREKWLEVDGCSILSSAVLFPPKPWHARMFPVQCVLLTIFKPHRRSFAEDSYKRVHFRVTKLYSITSRNDRFIQAEQLLVKWAEDGQENCLPGVGGCMKAHKWGEASGEKFVTL